MTNKTMNNELKIDRDDQNIRRSASMIIHTISRFIPDACMRDAYYVLCDAFAKEGIELTSKEMRKEYEAWKNISGPSGLYSKPE